MSKDHILAERQIANLARALIERERTTYSVGGEKYQVIDDLGDALSNMEKMSVAKILYDAGVRAHDIE